MADIPGCGRRLHPRGEGVPGPWSAAVDRDVMLENYGNLASLGEDNCLPESLKYLQGFGSFILECLLECSALSSRGSDPYFLGEKGICDI